MAVLLFPESAMHCRPAKSLNGLYSLKKNSNALIWLSPSPKVLVSDHTLIPVWVLILTFLFIMMVK
jgi:hypothetical protein